MSKALIPPEALEGLMQKVFVERAVQPGLFWDALTKSNLFVPLPEGHTAPPESPDPAEFSMVLGVDSDGKQVIWLFTSPGALAEYTEQKLSHLALPAPTLFANMRSAQHDVVLIGRGGLTLNLNAELMDGLAEGRVPEQADQAVRAIPREAKVAVGAPVLETEELEEALTTLFEELPEVQEAQFIDVAFEENERRLVLGVRLNDESRTALQRIAERVARAVEGILEKGQTMDITCLSGSLKGAFEKWGKRFYQR